MRRCIEPAAGLVLSTILLAACAQPQAPTASANPASENCIRQGGTLSIQKRGDGGEYGVCTFEENRQCEEWALMRGTCPTGGRKITGYITPAAQYCVITGGEYRITDENAEPEQGKCSFGSGRICDAGDYYNGKCEAAVP